jgi:hypothetical protein
MSAQITGPTIFALELVALAIGTSMFVGAIDLIRQPQWAWKRAEENKAAYLALVVLVPIVGLGLYVFRARPHVVAAASGTVVARPAARASGPEEPAAEADPSALAWAMVSAGFNEMAALTDDGDVALAVATPLERSEPLEISSTFFSSGTTTRARPYRPRQRTSLDESPLDTRTTVPAGWNSDPTARHQFRYWDGAHWTENVADGGRQSRDSVSS